MSYRRTNRLMGLLGSCVVDPSRPNALLCGGQDGGTPYPVAASDINGPVAYDANGFALGHNPNLAVAPSASQKSQGNSKKDSGSKDPDQDNKSWFDKEMIPGVKNSLVTGGASFLLLLVIIQGRR